MADPRWTIDDNGDLLCDVYRVRPAILEPYGCLDAPAAHQALVQCVRDADTLAQARDLARSVAAYADPISANSALAALLDLLTGDQP
jgi:hypothetical protein